MTDRYLPATGTVAQPRRCPLCCKPVQDSDLAPKYRWFLGKIRRLCKSCDRIFLARQPDESEAG